jgi:rod shape-determining protein MreB
LASLDIGIDLGTSNIIASDSGRGVIVSEPSVVALHRDTGKVLSIGKAVYRMIGRTPENIQVVRPLQDGVISDFAMTEVLIRHVLGQISQNQLVKPRVILCVPSSITNVESQAVIDAAVSAGARKVYLIEEPVAAAIGAGLNISKPHGNLIVDVGGGTCDIAVLSLGGIVCKSSLKVAGNRFDDAIARHMRSTYNMLIGERTAEAIKIEIGSVWQECEDKATYAKGRDLLTGLPKKVLVHRSEFMPCLLEPAEAIVRAVQGVFERTPPELVGDIRTSGIVLTGGGALLGGLDLLLERGTKVPVRIAERAMECVAIGTARSFDYLDKLFDGFVHTSTHVH